MAVYLKELSNQSPEIIIHKKNESKTLRITVLCLIVKDYEV